jgi:hypothetical protein
MSRRICVALYDVVKKLRPQWHSDDDEAGAIKVVMTGAASDPPAWQPHIGKRPKARRELIAKRAKNAAAPLKLVIVRDMWLTGFDAPCMHTMYVDKPMKGHGLMQAIARVRAGVRVPAPRAPWAVLRLGERFCVHHSLDRGKAQGDTSRANESPPGTGAPRNS